MTEAATVTKIREPIDETPSAAGAAATTLTQALADFATGTGYADLPLPVVREAKRLLLDTIGCALGAIDTDSGRIAIGYADRLGGNERATVLGLGRRNSVTAAAYANARLANVLDADDTFPTSTHFGNAVVFAALALAEDLDRSGSELLTAIAVGFDVGARIGSWMGPPMQIVGGEVIGWNELGGPAATMTWAGVGAAVAIAGLDPVQANHAFGIAGANSPQPTLRKWAASPFQPMYKYGDAGWCAEAGVSAAILAGMGSTGFLDILDGPDGFWKMYGSPSHDDDALLAGLGRDWQILNTTYKPWPCCRWIHHPLTAFGRLRDEHSLTVDEIKRVVVRANPFALTAIFRDRQPTEMLSAEFSHAHAIAALAYEIPPGPRWYSAETFADPAIAAFRARVDVEPEPTSANIGAWITGGQWRGVPGGVDIHARGRVFSATADMSTGDPWSTPTLFSDAAIKAKFETMIGLELASGQKAKALKAASDRVVETIAALDTLAGMAPLTEAMGVLVSLMRDR